MPEYSTDWFGDAYRDAEDAFMDATADSFAAAQDLAAYLHPDEHRPAEQYDGQDRGYDGLDHGYDVDCSSGRPVSRVP